MGQYHTAIKMKPADVKDDTYIDFKKNLMTKILNLKLAIVSEFLDKTIFSLKDTHRIGLKKILLLLKLKIPFHGHMLLMITMQKKLLEHFMKKSHKRLIKKEFRIEKVIKRKGDKLYVQWKDYANSFNSWINKKDLV